MAKFALICDSISGINKSHLAQENVHMVPFNVHIGDKSFKEFEEISPQEFYKEIEKSDQLPSTAANSIGGWYQVMEEAYENGAEEILCLVTPETLSNMANAAQLAKQMMEDEDDHPKIIVHILTQILGGGSILLDEILRLRDEGLTLDDTMGKIEAFEDQLHSYLALGDLEFMLSGGRMAKDNENLSESKEKQEKVMASLGKTLDITGKFETDEELIDAFVQVLSKAVEEAEESGQPIRAKLFKGSFQGRGDVLYDRLKQTFPDLDIDFDWLTSSALTHLGQDSFNLSWGPDNR